MYFFNYIKNVPQFAILILITDSLINLQSIFSENIKIAV